MLRKSTLLAVAASAAIGLALLAPSAASAHGHGSGGHGKHMGGHGGLHGDGKFRRIRVGHRHHRHWHRHYVRWHRPILVSTPVAYGLVRPVAGPCTCLTKEYTPEGAVLFKDRCTNEAAMNPPPAPGPQQTGEIESQGQSAYAAQLVQPTPANALSQQPIPNVAK
jgi:hypothetical protein